MVNTESLTDGQAVISVSGHEGEDADEPPIRRGVASVDVDGEQSSLKSDKSVRDCSYPTTAGSTIVAVGSQDGSRSDGNTAVAWDGDVAAAHLFDAGDVVAWLGVDAGHGLSTSDASERLASDGPNKIDGAGSISIGEILLRQVSNSLTIVLVIAMALSYGTLDFIEGAVISAVVLLNIILGFVQDFRAERTMQSLLSLAAPSSQVIRNHGAIEIIKAETLVAGDVVRLTTGVVVPADIRLLESGNLEIDEALLTGESLPSGKHVDTIYANGDGEVALGDRTNMVYSATTVTRGRATGVVVATGMKTQVGTVAELLRGQKFSDDDANASSRFLKKIGLGIKSVLGLVGTPMQIKLSKFAIMLFGLAVLLAIIVFSANKWKLHNEVVLYGICVAVAVIPESLIAVMTITIAVGVKAMARGNVVIRRMAALEAIGGVTNICSDKTGTLTRGSMVVHKLWIPDVGTLCVQDTTDLLDPDDGKLTLNNEVLDRSRIQQLRPALDAVALCNFATVSRIEGNVQSVNEKALATREWQAVGDPTEIALQVLAMRFGRGKTSLLCDGTLKSLMEHQFDSTLKRMSVAYKNLGEGEINIFAKGASESIIPILDLSEEEKAALEPVLEQLASEGLRVLCIAAKTVPEGDQCRLEARSFMESNLRFQGFVGLYDPPRIESLEAVRKCHGAGIAVHMLTGDHLSTATAIAEKVGILQPHLQGRQSVMRAQDFDKLSEAEIDTMPSLPVVLARCSPITKVRMVDALTRRKAFCLMTGDGINDAPALKRAHVGIAMGINGTDVAKDAADMVLTDDNFASIVKAVEEGRRLFDNIQKFLMHLLISNIAQVILLLIALAFKDNDNNSVFPLSPLEILWVNMVTSSFLALGLGMEEAQADIMVRPPRDLRIGVFTWELITDKMLYGSWAGLLCLISFISVAYGAGHGNLGQDCNDGWNDDGSCDVVFRGRATVFAVLSFLLLVTAWEVKHFTRSLFNLDPARFKGTCRLFQALVYNRFLLWAVVAGFVITFPVIYIPVINTTVFKHKGISWEWGIVVGCSVAYIALVEAWKGIKRRFGLFAGSVAGVEGESAA